MLKLQNMNQSKNKPYRDAHEQHPDVDDEEHKELAVVEAHAVVDPGAVVVHIQDAAVADGAVVRPIGFPDVAHLAVAPPLRLVAHVEAPIRRHHARICHDRVPVSNQ